MSHNCFSVSQQKLEIFHFLYWWVMGDGNVAGLSLWKLCLFLSGHISGWNRCCKQHTDTWTAPSYKEENCGSWCYSILAGWAAAVYIIPLWVFKVPLKALALFHTRSLWIILSHERMSWTTSNPTGLVLTSQWQMQLDFIKIDNTVLTCPSVNGMCKLNIWMLFKQVINDNTTLWQQNVFVFLSRNCQTVFI